MLLLTKGNESKDHNHRAGISPNYCVSSPWAMKKCLTTAKNQSNTYVEHTEIWELIK